MELLRRAASNAWKRHSRIIVIILVTNVALGMSISVIALFNQAVISNRAEVTLTLFGGRAAEAQAQLLLDANHGAVGRGHADPGAQSFTITALTSSLSSEPKLLTPSLIGTAGSLSKSLRLVSSLLRMGNASRARKLLEGSIPREERSFNTALQDSLNNAGSTNSRTLAIADAETLSMMVFAALLSALLFRRFSFERISSELKAATERERAQARFRSLVNNSSDVLIVMDSTLKVLYATPSWERSLGWSVDDIVDRTFTEFIAPSDAVLFLSSIDTSENSDHAPVTLRWLHADGSMRYVESQATSLLDDPDVAAIVINARDVTERVRLEEQLITSTFYDALTGLANRVLFNERLAGARVRMLPGQSLGVLFIDLNDFKSVNDTYGHESGDELLKEIATRLQGAIGGAGTAARFGGDEFAVLLEPAVDLDPALIASRIIAELSRPIRLSEGEMVIQASIGGARADHASSDHGDILRHADVAMYVAKRDRNASYAEYDSTMHRSILERLQLKGEIQSALDRGEFTVHYQPVVTLENSEIVGVEALVRWPHPQQGMLSPVLFIPLAEETGLIVGLGRFVLETACSEIASWNRRNQSPIFLNVNLSVRQLQEPDVVSMVATALANSGIDPTILTLEITESVLMQQRGILLERLTAIRELGPKIAIDDFGTGYSSLSYLENLPVDTLKIDKSFTDTIATGESSVTLRTIVQLGRELNLKMVVEGIEEPEQIPHLREIGCVFGQGFHFSRPLDHASLMELLERGPRQPQSTRRERDRFSAVSPIDQPAHPTTDRAIER